MKSKFYEFIQNNTGGSFNTDSKLCHRLFIEADSVRDANDKAENLGCYWNGVKAGYDCKCCGDRWSQETDSLDMEGMNIEQYAQKSADFDGGYTKPECRIFYKNGEVKEIYSTNVK